MGAYNNLKGHASQCVIRFMSEFNACCCFKNYGPLVNYNAYLLFTLLAQIYH